MKRHHFILLLLIVATALPPVVIANRSGFQTGVAPLVFLVSLLGLGLLWRTRPGV